ncbi:MAG: HTTM domain-containing protein [Myxococcales bacterium]|nr:HTTM domain-containing protein [Myxococcales bacterium]MCA9700560.1 HTTM domain-containing protein [Myxococcales bacterium]
MRTLLDRFGDHPRHLRGAATFRFVVGMTLLYQLTMLIGHFDLTMGRSSIYGYEAFAAGFGRIHYSYMALSGSDSWQWAGFLFAIVVVGLWTVGAGAQLQLRGVKLGHLLTALAWWAVHSIHSRCPTLWDGGDNLIEIILIYAVVIDLWGGDESRPPGRLAITLHNLAILACALQICIMYFTAGMAKVPGKYWQNGTAFYYVLASREFGMTDLGSLVWNNRVLLALTTWGPLLLQLAFPWIYFFGRPWPRRITVLLAMSFHVGILVLMGLNTFAVIMVGAELLLLSDEDFAALGKLLRSLYERLPRLRRPESEGDQAPA